MRLNQGITGRRASNLFGAVTNGAQVMTASSLLRDAHTPDGYLVQYPPLYRKSQFRYVRQAVFDMFEIMLGIATQPEISCPSVSGVASCKGFDRF